MAMEAISYGDMYGLVNAGELARVYDTISSHCIDSETQLTVTKMQFMEDSVA